MISLDNTNPTVLRKLLQYIYTGEVMVTTAEKSELRDLVDRMKINIFIEADISSESSESDTETKPTSKKMKSPPRDLSTSSSSSDDDAPPPPKKSPVVEKKLRKNPLGPKSKQLKKASTPTPPIFSSSSSSSESDHENVKKKEIETTETTEQRLEREARSDKRKVVLEPVDKSSKPEIAKYVTKLSTNKKVNPLFARSKVDNTPKAAPQKRRMSENDKKVETKDSKKMRQEESSSDVDSDAVAKRKKEVPSSEKINKKKPEIKKEDENSSDDNKVEKRKKPSGPASALKKAKPVKEEKEDTSDEDNNKNEKRKRPSGPASALKKAKPVKQENDSEDSSDEDDSKIEKLKRPPGPASAGKKAKGKPTPKSKKPAALDNIYATQGIQICEMCNAIFVTSDALANHKAKNHTGAKAKVRKDDSSSSNSDTDESGSESDGKAGQDQAKVNGVKSEKSTKKTPEKIKEERRKRLASSSSSTSDEDKPSPSIPNSKLKVKTPKVGPKKSASEPIKKRASSIGDDDGGSGFGCILCDYSCDKHANLKNHVLNHFKDQLCEKLPSSKPYSCPECKSSSRDKVTLMRHYAFTHSKIFLFCTPEQLKGRRTEAANSTSTPKPTKKMGPKSSVKKPEASATEKQTLANSLLSSDSENESQDKKTTEKKDNETSEKTKNSQDSNDSKDVNGKTEEVSETKSVTQPIKFSDESDDEFNASSVAKDAVKSFDDIFGKEEDNKNIGKSDGDKKIVFNKDDSDDEPEAKKPVIDEKENGES